MSDTAWLVVFIVAAVLFLLIVTAIILTWAPPWLKRLTGWLAV